MGGKHNDLTPYYAKGLCLCFGYVIKENYHLSQKKNHQPVHTEPNLSYLLWYLCVLHIHTEIQLLDKATSTPY